jgi:hypothetical protein
VLQYADYCAWLEEIAAAGDDDALAGIAYWRARNHLQTSVVLPFQHVEDAGDERRIGDSTRTPAMPRPSDVFIRSWASGLNVWTRQSNGRARPPRIFCSPAIGF